MLLLATVCALAGTWQIQRLGEKHSANVALRHNAQSAVAPVGRVLPTSRADQAGSQGHEAKFRPVSAAGTYEDSAQLLVREQTVEDTVGYLVLTPLRTGDGVDLLVVRGFVAADKTRAPAVPPAPGGQVTIIGRVQPSVTQDDEFARSPAGQVRTVNAAQAAARLSRAVYAGYVELLPGQPGTNGVTVIPAPDLSNAAGGAIEPQHVAYIVQWYIFALIALATPVMMARAEQRRDQGDDADSVATDPWATFDSTRDTARSTEDHLLPHRQSSAPPEAGADVAAKLSERYGTARRR